MVKVIKRDCTEVDFDKTKISNAIMKAMKNGSGIIKPKIAERIAEEIYTENKDKDEISISEIEGLVYDKLIAKKQKLTAKAYEGYRKIREFQRENSNTTDEQIAELLDGSSDYWNNENSNKNARLLTTQRDYMAGILSTDITRRYLLSPEIVQAHDNGILHFHDADYFAQNAISNCCLINLEDMLQNETCINKVTIEKPHRLITATTIATQIITAVTSSQYGGATITLSHLAPFVRESYDRYLEKYRNRGFDEEKCVQYAKEDLKKEIADSVQTFNYQINSMTTTNGQSPFLSVCMYLGETEEYKEELAMLIEEFLRQRIQGLKNEVGVYVTPAFPKLLYMLEEDNIHEGSKYWYLTVLAAQCTAKRMVPDYVSEKIMLELKGDVYPCMGCVDGKETITYKYNNNIYTESFEKMWGRLSKYFEIDKQPNLTDFIMKTPGVKIYDQKKGFVDNYSIIKNHTSKWLKITFSNGTVINCTPDHPFENTNGKIVFARDLTENDLIDIDVTKDDSYSRICHVIHVKEYENNSFSYDVTTSSEHFTVSGIYSHNCRSFLTPDRFTETNIGNIANALNYISGEHKYYGRFNQGVVTLNLPDIALSSGGDEDMFWTIFNERTELCHKALQARHKRLEGTISDVAPILWQHGAFARLKSGEKIDPLLHGGYSTLSLGYAGLYECVKYMTGHSHTDGGVGEAFGLEVMQALNDKCSEWKAAENIDYSLYGSPIESTTYKFAKCLKKRFGIIEGITDRDYITNSYHVPVFEEIDPFEKLTIESKFQKLSPGGAISYIECADLTHNTEAVLEVIKFIYDHIMYAELNTKSDYCQACGYDGEIKIIEENGELIWECPNCGNRDKTKMNVARRTCGLN